MKIRNGFISNSSSSSFLIDKYYLSQSQINDIINHKELAPKLGMSIGDYDSWYVEDLGRVIKVSTIMDNFSMRNFLRKIRVAKEAINED